MRNNPILTIVIVTILALGGIYTAYWFKQSNECKQILEQAIAHVNETAKTKKSVPTIKYASISVSGFPFYMNFNINKPVLDIPASEIIKTAFPSAATKPLDVILEISYDQITAGANVMVSDFSLSNSGQNSLTPLVDGKAGNTMQVDLASPFTCGMKIDNPSYKPWDMPYAFADAESFFTAFRSLDCKVTGVTAKDAASNTVISTLENMQLSLANAPLDQVNHKLTLLFDIKNAKDTPAYDNLMAYYFQLFYDLAGIPQDQRTIDTNFSQYGAQNSIIDISYQGPLDKAAMLDSHANIHFDIAAMNFRNDVYTLLSEMHMSNITASDTRNAAATIHWSLTAGEPYERLLSQQVAKTIRQVSADPFMSSFMMQLAANSSPDEIASALVPRFHTLGKISFDTDIALKGLPGQDFTKGGSIVINQLDLSNSQYGVKVKGNGKSGANPMPTGELLATCVLCDTLVDGAAIYAAGIDQILAKSRPGHIPYVTTPLAAGIKQFLHALDEPSTSKAPGSILIHLVAADNGKITISGKEFPEVFGLYGTYIASHLPHAQPQTSAPVTTFPATPARMKPTK